MTNFIESYEQAFDPQLCHELIARFERHPAAAPGRAGETVDTSVKHSVDLTITQHPEFADLLPQIGELIFDGLLEYLRSHPNVLLASTALTLHDPQTGASERLDVDSFGELPDGQVRELARSFFRCGEINLQKYVRGEGGYFAWHTEVSPSDPSGEKLHRVLPFMAYLNDVEDGGETEFYYQELRVKPVRGTLLIWPAYFTHTHRGLTPRSGDKYILTGWILFQRAPAA